jgi:hypothetical protein
MADNKLEHFLSSTGGYSYVQQEHTWKGKGYQVALDHVITWNYHLPPQVVKPSPKSHKKIDHNQIWTQLPHLDCPRLANPARTPPPDFSQRIDTVNFKRHVDDWKARIKTQIQRDLNENPTGQALAALIHKEQGVLEKRSDGCRTKHGWRADKQGKGKNIGIKHRTPCGNGSPY